jgi:hypothetical protein
VKWWLVQSTNPTGKRTHIYWNPAHSPHPLWSFLFCFNTTKGTERKHKKKRAKRRQCIIYTTLHDKFTLFSRHTQTHCIPIICSALCPPSSYRCCTLRSNIRWQDPFPTFLGFRNYTYLWLSDWKGFWDQLFRNISDWELQSASLYSWQVPTSNRQIRKHPNCGGKNLTTWMTVCLHKLLVANLFKKSFCFHGNYFFLPWLRELSLYHLSYKLHEVYSHTHSFFKMPSVFNINVNLMLNTVPQHA